MCQSLTSSSTSFNKITRQAVPGKVKESVDEAIEDAVEDVVEAVEEAVSIPKKKLKELGLLPEEGTKKKPLPALPKATSSSLPPPPPPPQQQKKQVQKSLLPPADQKLEMPKFTFPKFEEEEKAPKKKTPPPTKKETPPPVKKQQAPVPKFTFPKFEEEEAPKKKTPPPPKKKTPPPPAKKQQTPVELPKFSFPKAATPPPPKKAEPAAKAPPAKKEKKKDNNFFTESALKKYIAKDKPQSTELDKQQVAERKARDARDAEIGRAADKATSAFNKKQPIAQKKSTPPKVKKAATKKTQAAVAPKETPISVTPVNGRPTFSLFGLGGGAAKVSASSEQPTQPVTKATTKTAVAPRGVPTISKWKLNPRDNSISGFISGSSAFKEGEPVTTSAIVDEAAGNSVVRTKSGSR